MVEPPFCIPDNDPRLDTCGHLRWAVLYCVSYIVISSFLLVNLVLAAVLKQFEQDSDLTPDADQAYLTSTETKEFCMTWAQHNNDYFMASDKLGVFLTFIPEGLRRPPDMTMTRFINLLNVPCDEQDAVSYVDVLYRLVEFRIRYRLGMSIWMNGMLR